MKAKATGAELGMAARRFYADVPVEYDPASIVECSGTITVDGLVDVARDVLRAALQAGVAPVTKKADKETNARLDKLYKTLWDKYTNFALDYPIIFRQIVYHHEFSEKAFRVYMKNFHKPMWKDREDMLCEQSEYLVLIWREKNRRTLSASDNSRLNEYRKYIRKHLLEENEKFNEAVKEAEEIRSKNEAERKRRIAEALQALLAPAGHFDRRRSENSPDNGDPKDSGGV